MQPIIKGDMNSLEALKDALSGLPPSSRSAIRDLSEGLEREGGEHLPRLASLLGLPEVQLSTASLVLALALRGVQLTCFVDAAPLLPLHHALSRLLERPRLLPSACRLLRTTPRGLHRARLSLGLLLTASRPASRSLDV